MFVKFLIVKGDKNNSASTDFLQESLDIEVLASFIAWEPPPFDVANLACLNSQLSLANNIKCIMVDYFASFGDEV